MTILGTVFFKATILQMFASCFRWCSRRARDFHEAILDYNASFPIEAHVHSFSFALWCDPAMFLERCLAGDPVHKDPARLTRVTTASMTLRNLTLFCDSGHPEKIFPSEPMHLSQELHKWGISSLQPQPLPTEPKRKPVKGKRI